MRGDPSAEALSYKQVSRSASEPLPLSLVIVKTPCGQRVILREAEKKRRSRFAAQKAWRGIEGRRVWKVASGTWEVCGAKATAEVGRGHSSVEAGNDRGYPPSRRRVAKRCPSRGAKGSCIESASNRSAGADSLRKKRMTEEEIAAIAAKHRMAK